ncbi:hypothetical protein BGZ52_001315 [Haplosporangium bisporale]|nr:hypothetical protein BGZ52_001315 [Haplosporangium bisporale]
MPRPTPLKRSRATKEQPTASSQATPPHKNLPRTTIGHISMGSNSSLSRPAKSLLQPTAKMCKFDLAKELGCRKCYLGLSDEECVSIGESELEIEMVPPEAWTDAQRAEAAAASAAEITRLGVVAEVQTALEGMTTNSSPERDATEANCRRVRESPGDSLDEIDFTDVDFSEFDDEVEELHQDQEHGSSFDPLPSPLPPSPPPVVIIPDDEDESDYDNNTTFSSWSGFDGQELPTLTPDSPPPVLQHVPYPASWKTTTQQPLLPLDTVPMIPLTIPAVGSPKRVVGYDISVRFVFDD